MLAYECLMPMSIDYLNFISYASYKTSHKKLRNSTKKDKKVD